jgi:hypothetical protein
MVVFHRPEWCWAQISQCSHVASNYKIVAHDKRGTVYGKNHGGAVCAGQLCAWTGCNNVNADHQMISA